MKSKTLFFLLIFFSISIYIAILMITNSTMNRNTTHCTTLWVDIWFIEPHKNETNFYEWPCKMTFSCIICFICIKKHPYSYIVYCVEELKLSIFLTVVSVQGCMYNNMKNNNKCFLISGKYITSIYSDCRHTWWCKRREIDANFFWTLQQVGFIVNYKLHF